MSALRGARWPQKYAALKKAQTIRKINPVSGRQAMHYRCAHCDDQFIAKQVSVDHILPVVPVTGFDSWDGVISRLFCENAGLQVLCEMCHKTKTTNEREARKK